MGHWEALSKIFLVIGIVACINFMVSCEEKKDVQKNQIRQACIEACIEGEGGDRALFSTNYCKCTE